MLLTKRFYKNPFTILKQHRSIPYTLYDHVRASPKWPRLTRLKIMLKEPLRKWLRSTQKVMVNDLNRMITDPNSKFIQSQRDQIRPSQRWHIAEIQIKPFRAY